MLKNDGGTECQGKLGVRRRGLYMAKCETSRIKLGLDDIGRDIEELRHADCLSNQTAMWQARNLSGDIC